jgi:GTP-binding protein
MHGIHPLDEEVIELVRRAQKPALFVVNKGERAGSNIAANEFYALGIKDLLIISASHRQGLRELVRLIRRRLGIKNEEDFLAIEEEESYDNNDESKLPETSENQAQDSSDSQSLASLDKITVALVGRPNVGKSSLINRIVGANRVVVSSQAGTTRDSIHIDLIRDGQNYTLIDTAGLRKKARVADGTVERFSTLRTTCAVAQADVVIVVLDATEGMPSEQEAKIARLIHDRGKGLILVVNKWDAIEKDHRTVQAFTESIFKVMPFARYAPVLFVSALQGRRCPSLLQVSKEVAITRHERMQTSVVHRIFDRALIERPPPIYRGTPIKLFYATQVDSAPPTFVLFVNAIARLKPSYERYLEKIIRKHKPFRGSSIKIILRKRNQKTTTEPLVARV